MVKKIMSNITDNWFPLLLLAVLIFLLIRSQIDINKYKSQVIDYKEKIETLRHQIDVDMHIIDSLSDIDVVFVKEIDTIKLKADEKIKFVDTMSVSDMQSFYSDRYKD